MVESKAWNWTAESDPKWLNPSEESHWLVNRWVNKGFMRLLDLGSGLGRHSILFARRRFNVSAMDLSKEGIENLRDWSEKEGLHIDTVIGDMLSLPYPDNFFDCLLSFHVIYHTDTAGIRRALAEIKRVLKPGGEFYLTLMSKEGKTFRQAGYPVIDESTVLKTEDGPEKDTPHFCADYQMIRKLFEGFILLQVRQVEDFDLDGDASSWHYHVLGMAI